MSVSIIPGNRFIPDNPLYTEERTTHTLLQTASIPPVDLIPRRPHGNTAKTERSYTDYSELDNAIYFAPGTGHQHCARNATHCKLWEDGAYMRRATPGILLALFFAFNSMLFGRTFVVATGGNDSNPGTLTAPWRTLAKANTTLRAGDTVLVRGGTYHERIAPAQSGASGSPLVYRASPGEQVIIDGANDNNLNLVALYGSWVIIEGFTFHNQDYFSLPNNNEYWVILEGSHNTFRYNRLVAYGDVLGNIYTRKASSRGIAEAGRYNTIEHCYIRGLSFGIVIAGSSPRYTVVRYDTIHAIGQNCIDVGATADGSTAYHGTLIEFCVLDTSFVEDNIQFEPDYGNPTSTLYNRGTIIRNNVMGNAAENAIDLKGAGHTLIENNLMYSSSGDDDGPLNGHDAGSGGGVSANANTPTRNTIVRGNVIWDHTIGLEMAEGDHYYNNTVLNNRRTWLGPNQTGESHAGLLAFNYPNQQRAFLNNIVAGQPSRGIYNWMMDWGDKFYLDNNLYYDQGTSVRFYHRKDGTMITTVGLASWKNELATYGGYAYMKGKDASAREADPAFVNVPAYPAGYDRAWNFGLRAGSPAIDAGVPVALTTSSGVNTTTLTVNDAYFFCDGFGIIEGDNIRIGGGTAVRISSIDYTRNIVTLREPRTWAAGAGVHPAYNGNAPDIGAFESGGTAPQIPASPAAVQLALPADGASGILLQSALTWTAASTALSYQVQVSVGSAFNSTVIDASNVVSTSYSISSLADSTRYYWRVRGVNQGGAGLWSTVRVFTTAPKPGGSVPEAAPVLRNSDFESGTQEWTFHTGGTGSFVTATPGFTGASAARITISTTADNIQLYQQGVSLKANTIYRLTFSGYSTSGQALAVGLIRHSSPFTDYGLQARMVPLSTQWRTYTVYLQTKNFSGTVTDARLQFLFSGFARAGDRYWLDAVDLQESSAPPIPTAPVLTLPAGGATNQPTVTTIRWTGFEGADGYRVQLARNASFASLVHDSVAADTVARVGPLEAATRYYYRVNAMNISGAGPFSASSFFTTASEESPAKEEDVLPAEIHLDQNYPNPFNPNTIIHYRLPAQTHVSLKVYNMIGEEVAVLADAEQQEGDHYVTFDGAALPSGAYFFRLRANGVMETRKMILAR